jgi:hypothetical protein
MRWWSSTLLVSTGRYVNDEGLLLGIPHPSLCFVELLGDSLPLSSFSGSFLLSSCASCHSCCLSHICQRVLLPSCMLTTPLHCYSNLTSQSTLSHFRYFALGVASSTSPSHGFEDSEPDVLFSLARASFLAAACLIPSFHLSWNPSSNMYSSEYLSLTCFSGWPYVLIRSTALMCAFDRFLAVVLAVGAM